MALGAQPQGLLRSIVRDGLALTAAGAVIGITGGVVFTRLLSALLFETSPKDVLTFIAISALLFVVAALACFVPARQVIAIDPTIALRQA